MNRLSLYVSAAVGIVCAVAGATAAAKADDAAALLAKHKAYVGWSEGDGTFTSWRFTATRTINRHAQSETKTVATQTLVEVRRGALYRDSYTESDNPLASDDGFTGRLFWDADENGNTVTVLGDSVREELSVNALFDEATATLAGKVLRTAKIGDVNAVVVEVAPPLGFPIELYVDPTSGAYLRAFIRNPQNRGWTIDIQRYVEALPGKKVIGAWLWEGGSASAMSVDKVEPNVSIADADLRPPKPRTHWDFADNDPVPIEIISDSNPDGTAGHAVVVRASINGDEGRFLLDSGAAGTTLYAPFADRVNAEKVADGKLTGVNGRSVDAPFVRVATIAIGHSVLHDVIVQTLRPDTPAGIDGLLGYDVLANALVDVSLANGRLLVLDPARFAPTIAKGAYAFPVDLTTRQPVVRATSGKANLLPIIDTGNETGMVVSERQRDNGNMLGVQTGEEWTGGIDGSAWVPVPCQRMNAMQLGPYRYEAVPVCFGKASVFGEDGGLIGYDFLRHFDWTFDYPDGKIVLTPNGQ